MRVPYFRLRSTEVTGVGNFIVISESLLLSGNVKVTHNVVTYNGIICRYMVSLLDAYYLLITTTHSSILDVKKL